jgi:membrane-bound serine protease (ClpP class)
VRALARQLAALALAGVSLGAMARAAAGEKRPVALIRIERTIDVPSAEYLERSLEAAQRMDAQCLLILLNTPGGLGQPMKDMVEDLLNAPIPSIVYVYPAGGFAQSAGTFITLAASIAAMNPATTIGAATPVDMIPLPTVPEPGEGEKKPPSSSDAERAKVVNTFAELIRVIADTRGRNAEWAERAVREGVAIGARKAVELHVVDLLADNVDDLLAKVDGREVSLPSGRKVTLRTDGAPVVEIPASVKERFLHVLSDPNILLVLLVLGGLGLIFELQNPGSILPGVVGGLCLVLALYSMAVLPVNYAGVGLILFSMLLFLAEVKVPSHGVLTVGGVVSFVMGALMLTNTPLAPALRVSWQVIVVLTVLMVGFFLFVVGAAIRAHMRKVQTGLEGMVGQRGRALSALTPTGEVFVEGERWRARSADGNIPEGEPVVVLGQDGLTLLVRRQDEPAGGETRR